MLNTELQASTGVSQIDAVLRGLLGIYQTVFPGRLRCLYVLGSHSNGSAVAGSDLDFGVVFAEPLAEEQLQQFRQINQSISLISPVRLDWGIVNPKRFTNGIPAGLRSALVVYGENVFNDLPLEPSSSPCAAGCLMRFTRSIFCDNAMTHCSIPCTILTRTVSFMAMNDGAPIWGSETLVPVCEA